VKAKILLVDDDADILEFLSFNLEADNYEVHTAADGDEGLRAANSIKPDLIILDVMMPKLDGIETCQKIRSLPGMQDVLIAFLTARGEDYSQIAGFDAGADDYITKPIKPNVLLKRIQALLKRRPGKRISKPEKANISAGDLLIDKTQYKVFYKGNEIILPKKEFKLISLLASKPDKVFTREEIYGNIWGDTVVVGDRTIDVYIRKLRKKIPAKHIETIKGVGYRYIV
jgi:two-component system alkaline phosphatase synthesis response regulator PhoP